MDLLLDRMDSCAIGLIMHRGSYGQFWAATSPENAMSEPTRTALNIFMDYPR